MALAGGAFSRLGRARARAASARVIHDTAYAVLYKIRLY